MFYRPGLLLIALSFFLCSCGLQPLYSPRGHASHEELSKIRINRIPDRIGQNLKNNLITLLTPKGTPTHTRYALNIDLKEETRALGVLKDATYSNSLMTYTATFDLVDLNTNKVIYKSYSSVVSDYNVIAQNQFATVASATNTQDRGLNLLAQQIQRSLSVFFHNQFSKDSFPDMRS